MKITDFIICDDIRKEVGGKYSLIGVYLAKIVFSPKDSKSRWPINKSLGFYIRLIKEDDDPPFDGFNLIISEIISGKEQLHKLGKLTGTIQGDGSSGPIIFDVVIPLNFPSVGNLIFEINFLNNTESVIKIVPEIAFEIAEEPLKAAPSS